MYNRFWVRFEQAMKESAAGSAVEPYLEIIKGAEAAMKKMDEQKAAPGVSFDERMKQLMEQGEAAVNTEAFRELVSNIPADRAFEAGEPRQTMMERMGEWMEEETRRGTVETFVEPAEAAAERAAANA